MKRLVLLLSLLMFCALAYGRPVVVQETQWLPAPRAGLQYFAESVAVDGDWAVVTALRSADGSFNYPYQQLAFTYRRLNGTWAFDRVLVEDDTDEASWNHPSVALDGGLLSVSTSPLRAFRLDGDTWTALPAPFPAAPGNAAWANGLTRIDGNTVAAANNRCFHGAGTAELTQGAWTAPSSVTGQPRSCWQANDSNSLDISSNTLVLTNPQEDSAHPPSELRIYQRTAPGQPWQLEQSLPTGEWGRGVALVRGDLVVGDYDARGNPVYRRGPAGWTRVGNLPTVMGSSRYYDGAWHIASDGDLVAFSASMFEDLPGAIAIYRRDASGDYEHVALLVTRTGDRLNDVVDISGNTVIVGGHHPDDVSDSRLYFFELPAEFDVPAVVQDDFEDGDTAGWQLAAGSFEITRRGVTRVLRQTGFGAATAVLSDSNHTTESLTVDVRIRELASGDSWVGIATRYRDADDHYYATLRNTGDVQFHRVRGGRSVLLASRPLAVTENASYRLRLESVGSRHRLFVNGVLQFVVVDPVFGRGRVALRTNGATADFDNVVVTPGMRLSLYDTDIENGSDCETFVTERNLAVSGSPAWDCSVFERPFLRQTSSAGLARATIGPLIDDQMVESRVLVESFAANGSQTPWLGVVTRHTDANNHYYLALLRSNEVALVKMVDGAAVELDRVPLTLAPGAWYRLRLEAVGDRLRGYVNNILYVQAADGAHARGNSGIATSRTAARFDYLRVFGP